MEGPPREACRRRQHEGEGLVEQSDADHESEEPGQRPREASRVRTAPQQQEERREQPERLRAGREEDASVAVGAEEREVEQRREQALRRAAAELPPEGEDHGGRGEGVEDVRPAQVPQAPMLRPVGADEALPEKRRRLGVAVPRDHRLQRQPVSRLRRGEGDLGVEQLVAVGRRVVAPERGEIRAEGQHDGGQRPCCGESHPLA